MSNSLNVEVLVSAKNEYTNQLVYLLSPEIYIIMMNIFNESQLKKKKRSISLRNFQLHLKSIPNWNNITVENNINPIKTKIPYLLDLITAIFISHIKVLSAVRLKDTDKPVQVKVPNLDIFLHKIIITIAEKIYPNPDIILRSKTEITRIIENIIEDSIRNQIPLDKILTEYLDGVFNNESENALSLKTIEGSSSNNNNNVESYNKSSESDSDLSFDDDDDEEEDNESHISINDENELKQIIPTRPLFSKKTLETQNISENEKIQNEQIQNEQIQDKKIQNLPELNKEKQSKVLFDDANSNTSEISSDSDDPDDLNDEDN